MTLFTESQARIARIIAEHLAVDPVKVAPDAEFLDDLGADSLDMLELAMAMEEEFQIEITDDEAAAVETVKDAFDLIASKTA